MDRAARRLRGPDDPRGRARALHRRLSARLSLGAAGSALLREGERSVGTLQADLELDSSGTSQHLAALRRIGLVTSRREGTSVYYSVEDEQVFELLAAGREIITRRLATQQSLLHELESE